MLPQGNLPNLGIEPASHASCTGTQILYHWRHLGSPRVLEGIAISLKGSFSRVLYLSRVFHCIWCSWELSSFYHHIFGNCLNPPLFIITVYYLLLLFYYYFYYWDDYFFSPPHCKIPLFSFTNLIFKIALSTISCHLNESLKHSLPLYSVASSRLCLPRSLNIASPSGLPSSNLLQPLHRHPAVRALS